MTVEDLIRNFRSALTGVLPAVERLGIPWRRPLAYDEWDSLAAAIYGSLVIAPCRWNLPEADQGRFRLPPYDLLLESYAGHSLIELNPGDRTDLVCAFHALGTTNEPFDTIEWRALSPSGTPLTGELETCPLAEARLALRHVPPDGQVKHLWSLAGPGTSTAK